MNHMIYINYINYINYILYTDTLRLIASHITWLAKVPTTSKEASTEPKDMA